jgi:hypothetical protein
LAIAALVTGLLGFVPAARAAATEPTPDPAPYLQPDSASKGGTAEPAPSPATQRQVPAPAQPAPAQPAPARRVVLQTFASTQPSPGTRRATAAASATRSGTARRRRASRTSRAGQARRDNRAPRVVAALPLVMPSGLLLGPEPEGSSSGDEAAAPALVLAGLALLLLVGASASFLHVTMRASDNVSRTRPA